MKPNTKTEPEGAPEPPPAIASLPTPTAEEVLQAKLAESTAREARLAAQVADLTQDLTKAQTDRETLLERLKAYEENAFSFAVANVDGGELVIHAAEEISRVTALVSERGEPAEMLLKLTIKPHQGSAFIFTADLKVKDPKTEPYRTVIYRTEDGKLVRQDPRQRELSL